MHVTGLIEQYANTEIQYCAHRYSLMLTRTLVRGHKTFPCLFLLAYKFSLQFFFSRQHISNEVVIIMASPQLGQPLPVYEKSALRVLLQNVSGTQMFLGASTLLLLYGFLIGIHRVYFSPLSHIPGPKIAAFTWWYEAYYNVIERGQYADIIKKMHEKYGVYIFGISHLPAYLRLMFASRAYCTNQPH
jgi:hypothetical protein